jgi:hypothetical protein
MRSLLPGFAVRQLRRDPAMPSPASKPRSEEFGEKVIYRVGRQFYDFAGRSNLADVLTTAVRLVRLEGQVGRSSAVAILWILALRLPMK